MAGNNKKLDSEPKQKINAVIRIIQQEEQEKKGTPKAGTGLKYFEEITKLVKVIFWPLVILVLVVVFLKPINQILGVLPSELSAASRLSIGDFSLEVKQQAIIQGYPDLANKLGDLSKDAFNVLLLTNTGEYYNVVTWTGDGQKYILPDPTYMEGLIELEQKGLIEFNINSSDWMNLFKSLNLQPAPSPSFGVNKMAYDVTRQLNDAEMSTFTSQGYKLTTDGITARTLIIQTISQLLTNVE
jgi:hypothetical protein